VLQETLAGFQVHCCALRLLHQARCGVHSCVLDAAAARVADERDIWIRQKTDSAFWCFAM
jgi:hypothetical protein